MEHNEYSENEFKNSKDNSNCLKQQKHVTKLELAKSTRKHSNYIGWCPMERMVQYETIPWIGFL